MKALELRQKYLEFFEESPRNHVIIPPAPLVLEQDPSTLFTSSGMQPLVSYLMGEKHPMGVRLVDYQPSLRLEDLDEVADNRHFTYFEMLGNWSLGDYFKQDQLTWFWEFLINKLKFPKEKLYVSVFEGNKLVPEDKETFKIWKNLGLDEAHIFKYGDEKNWWSRSGTPEKMPIGEIGGPDSEVFYDFGESLGLHEKSIWKKDRCHPNCDCGRFLEIGNSVFIQYKKTANGLEELPQKNVDFGGGWERMLAAINNDPDAFKTDIFSSVIDKIEKETGKKYGVNIKETGSIRIITDHLRASLMLIAQGVTPANKLHGYALRRLLRRSMFHLHLLGTGISGVALVHISEGYQEIYPELEEKWNLIEEVITNEANKFSKSLELGLRELRAMVNRGNITGKDAFYLYQSHGFPLELSLEVLKENGVVFDNVAKQSFMEEFEKHKSLSRTAAAGMFKGGLADQSYDVIKLHTATHLLHSSLRKVLADNVGQSGSNITSDRLRFDFTYKEKLSENELKNVEDMVNDQIKKKLDVSFNVMTLAEAKKSGALAFFAEKYANQVKVYTVGSKDSYFSKEVCGGPHVGNTGELGEFEILKQEKMGNNLIRIYAKLKN